MVLNESDALDLEASFEGRDMGAMMLSQALAVVLVSFTIGTNVCLLGAIVVHKTLRDPCNLLIASAAVLDIILGIGNVTLAVALLLHRFVVTQEECSYLTGPMNFGFIGGNAAIFVIAVDRFWAIFRPMSYRNLQKRHYVTALIMFSFGFPAFDLIYDLSKIPKESLWVVFCNPLNIGLAGKLDIPLVLLREGLINGSFLTYIFLYFFVRKKLRISVDSGEGQESLMKKKRLMGSLMLVMFCNIGSKLLLGTSNTVLTRVFADDLFTQGYAIEASAKFMISITMGSNFFIFYYRSKEWRMGLNTFLRRKEASSATNPTQKSLA